MRRTSASLAYDAVFGAALALGAFAAGCAPMPDTWERRMRLDPADPADRNRIGAGGYTMLENYLNSIVENAR